MKILPDRPKPAGTNTVEKNEVNGNRSEGYAAAGWDNSSSRAVR